MASQVCVWSVDKKNRPIFVSPSCTATCRPLGLWTEVLWCTFHPFVSRVEKKNNFPLAKSKSHDDSLFSAPQSHFLSVAPMLKRTLAAQLSPLKSLILRERERERERCWEERRRRVTPHPVFYFVWTLCPLLCVCPHMHALKRAQFSLYVDWNILFLITLPLSHTHTHTLWRTLILWSTHTHTSGLRSR